MLLFANNFNPADVPPLRAGNISISPSVTPKPPNRCNMAKEAFLAAVETTKEHIRAGDIFQLVLSHRFERSTYADPFEVYRSLRIVNPSPYMAYMQVRLRVPCNRNCPVLFQTRIAVFVTMVSLAQTRVSSCTCVHMQAKCAVCG
jgi:anthranilate synthase component I